MAVAAQKNCEILSKGVACKPLIKPLPDVFLSMNSSLKAPQEIPPHLEQDKLIEFLESLYRIFKIGMYYPAGHKVLDQAAGLFQRNISGVADTNRSVLIALKNKALFVEGQEILTETTALREFNKLIFDLGIGGIEIDRTILLPELLQFIKSLLFGRSQLQGIKEFTQARLANLPTSVRIVQKQFWVDENAILLGGESSEDAEYDLNVVFQVLAEQGLELHQIEQCKKFLNALSQNYASKPLNVKSLPVATWGDVRGLLIRIITNAYHLSESSGGILVQNDLSALSSIFLGLERENQDRESQEAIKLLASVFAGSSFTIKEKAGDVPKPKDIRSADNNPIKGINQLQAFVTDNFVPITTLEKIIQIDRREELAILLQLLQHKQEMLVEEKIRHNLGNILSTPLNTAEFETLRLGMIDLATCTDSSRFYDAVQFLVILLRSSPNNLSGLQFMHVVCQKIGPAGQILLWPILVNELLATGRAVDRQVFDELVTMAAGLPGTEMKKRWPELETMDCFQEKKIAEDIFAPGLKVAFPLFPFLLETSLKEQIGAGILKSVMANPSDWLIKAVAPLLRAEIPQHIKFLQSYLLSTQQAYFPIKLRVAAGTLVVQHLPEISEQERREAWVVGTIQAMPELQVEETREILVRITEEKLMVIVPKWPTACRRAASEALKNLRRNLL